MTGYKLFKTALEPRDLNRIVENLPANSCGLILSLVPSGGGKHT